MKHVGHPRLHIGLGLEIVVGVMRIQEVIGWVLRFGGWLILFADPDALWGFHPLRALYIDDLTHHCILPGEMSFVTGSRVFTGDYPRSKLTLYRFLRRREYSIFQASNNDSSPMSDVFDADATDFWHAAICTSSAATRRTRTTSSPPSGPLTTLGLL
jgi:hypothetical protein